MGEGRQKRQAHMPRLPPSAGSGQEGMCAGGDSRWLVSRPRIWCRQQCTCPLPPAYLEHKLLGGVSALPLPVLSVPRVTVLLLFHWNGQFPWAKIRVSARVAFPPEAPRESGFLASSGFRWPPVLLGLRPPHSHLRSVFTAPLPCV